MTKLVSARGVSVTLATANSPPAGGTHRIVDDISFELAAGEKLAIIGPNGAGKSTLLKCLAGEQGHEGVIEIQGLASEAKLRARQRAVLPQLSLLNFPYRVFEVVQLGRTPHQTGRIRDNQIVDEALALLDISYLKERLYTQLSGGERQRVQIARVMTQIWNADDAPSGTRLLLLDEPTNALDLGHQQMLMEAVSNFAAQSVAVIMVLHDINLAARYADKILGLLCSQQAVYGEVQEVINEQNIERLFGLKVAISHHPHNGRPLVHPY